MIRSFRKMGRWQDRKGSMMRRRKTEESGGIRHEIATIIRQSREVWRLIPWRYRLSLAGAVGIMSIASAANMAIALCMGQLVNVVDPQRNPTESQATLTHIAAMYLAAIGGAYLVREVMNVARRFLVEDTCTRIDRDMSVRVVSHLLTVNLAVLAQDQVGTLYGRITRGVDGLVRFLRVGFLDFVPALMVGTFALSATLVKQPRIALAMAGVIPVSLGLTIWQLITQKGIRLDLLASRERIDGTVVEQLGGLDYIRAANTHQIEAQRSAQAAEYKRAKELRTTSRCRSSARVRQSTRGSFTWWSWRSRSTCSSTASSGPEMSSPFPSCTSA